MKRVFINLKLKMVVLALMIVSGIRAQTHEVSKTVIKKFYKVPENGKLKISADFARIHIHTGSGDSLGIKITVRVKSDKRSTADQYLNGITYSVKQSGNTFYIENYQSGSASNYFYNIGVFKNRYVEYESVYEITMPASFDLHIDADYSVLKINDLYGKLYADMDYGRILAGNLQNSGNRIEGDYMTRNRIEMLRGGEINSDFSDFDIDLSFYLKIQSDYSKFHLNHAKTVVFEGDFSHLDAERIKSLYVDSDYARFRVKRLYKLKMQGDFNHLTVERLPSTAQYYDLKGEYGEYVIRNPDRVSFVYHLTGDYSQAQIMDQSITGERTGYYLNNDAKIRFRFDIDFGKLIIK